MHQFKSVTLEMSLKPFKKTEEGYMRRVIETIFKQWHILTDGAKEISVLLWTADGSEILEWGGNLDARLEWSHYLGGANNLEGWDQENDPERICLHSRCYDYMDNPPVFTYRTLKKIVSLIKEIGNKLNPDKRIRVGETFDPGPEFAKSDFKYNRHRECCQSGAMGEKSFVCCYTKLHGDHVPYAGFPNGIPEGTPFGTFFGRQSQHFLTDIGFDYLWLSNGFGFGMEPWASTGAIYDGKKFDITKFDKVKEEVLNFWTLFRKECPDFRIETRGTNLSVGIDIATDGVPLKEIYEGGFNILPPPNSPWAALNGDFGLELSGYMSRTAELPDKQYLFRYYVHDPWWMNSPWVDRYEGLPHDIYLPMSICRLDGNGTVNLPTHLNILTVDNSFGDMPAFCAYEPSVHIQKALRYAPDAPPPILWVYPFAEYHRRHDEKSIYEMFFEDWYIRGALNHGFPMSGVISTGNFIKSYSVNNNAYRRSILVSTVPEAGSEYEAGILAFIKNGGKVIFYGGVDHASPAFLETVNVEPAATECFGEMTIRVNREIDTLYHDKKSDKILHRKMTCGSGIDTVIRKQDNPVQPIACADDFVVAAASDRVAWLKGTCSAEYTGGHLLESDDETNYFSGESLMRYALCQLGYEVRFEKPYANTKEPVIMLSRHENAFMFSVCAADTTVKTKLKFPLGAPVLCGGETVLDEKGYAEYTFSKAEFRECRIFVEQREEGVLGCHEIAPVSYTMQRRIMVSGLKNATVRFLAPKYCETDVHAVLNSKRDFYIVGAPFESRYGHSENETYFEAKNVTGELVFSVPFDEKMNTVKAR